MSWVKTTISGLNSFSLDGLRQANFRVGFRYIFGFRKSQDRDVLEN